MPTLIISLVPFAAPFRNAIIHYCQVTGNPSAPEIHKHIYEQCLSQICFMMDVNATAFMYNLLELPDWRTLHFLETPINPAAVEFFREAVRAFALGVWENLRRKVDATEKYTYVLESCNGSMAVIHMYLDADQV